MYFDSFHALLTMGGHGVYVWAAYMVSILVIAAVLIAPVRRHKRFLLQLAGELKRSKIAAGGSATEEQ
jgi:heme exporter protein D